MSELYVNIDHVATLREARKTNEPNPVEIIKLLENTEVAGITTHLREDRRHIQDSDIDDINHYIQDSRLGFTFEMAASEEICKILLKSKATMATLVPEKREEVTTEGGLDVLNQKEKLTEFIKPIKDKGIELSCFVDPILTQIEASKEVGADLVEIHTGNYANLFMAYQYQTDKKQKEGYFQLLKNEIDKINQSVIYARGIGLKVNMGHGLTTKNLHMLMKVRNIHQYHIGHSLISNALFYGIEAICDKYLDVISPKPATL